MFRKLFLLLCAISSSNSIFPKTEKATKYDHITGNKFRALANYHIDKEVLSFNPAQIKNGDIIYVKTDFLTYFFRSVFPRIQNRFILISHNSDASAPSTFAAYLEHPHIIAWLGQNCDAAPHPKFIPIPIGFANEEWSHGNPQMIEEALRYAGTIKDQNRHSLLYINFSPSTNPVRKQLITFFKNNKLAFFAQVKDSKDYLREITHFRYILSPWGNGLDCHRTWEALCMGCIAIVKTSTLDPLYKDLPVIIVNDWDQITEEFLASKYQEMHNKDFSRNKLFMPYWRELINHSKKDY